MSSWVLLGPSGSFWVLLGSSGFSWVLLAPAGCSWVLLGPLVKSCPVLGPMVPYSGVGGEKPKSRKTGTLFGTFRFTLLVFSISPLLDELFYFSIILYFSSISIAPGNSPRSQCNAAATSAAVVF